MSRKDVEKALKLCGSPMTYSQFWKKVKLTAEQRKAKANACVHFLTGVPNSNEGWAFINQLKKYLHKGRYSIRLKGRGSRKIHGNQSFIPLKHAERYSIYIDYKIKDINSPGYNDSKVYTMEQKFRNIRGDLQVIKNQIDEILNEDK
jgi:hypothetical protein